MDDLRLVELAADRPEELFPTLHRAIAFRPLLIVLCTLPGFYALVHGTCGEVDALWGLRTLPVFNASEVETFVDPEGKGPEDALKWQPLLGNWLSALSVRLVGTASSAGFLAVPYLSTMLLVALCYVLFDRVSDSRVAFWTVALAAFHGPILAMVTENAPYALAVALAMGTFWGFLGHLQRGDQAVSIDLLVGGVALGLCALAGGPLSLAVVLILLLHILGLRGEKSTAKRGRMVRQRRVWVGWPALKSLSVCCLTAFAVGGWWVLMMRYSYGSAFWNGWLAGGLRHGEIDLSRLFFDLEPGRFSEKIARRFVGQTGMLTGATILGACCAIRELFVQEDEQRRRQYQFLVAWWVCALVMFVASVRSANVASVTGPLWQLFLMIPSVGCAGLALDEVSRRRVRVETVGALTCATLFLGYLWAQPQSDQVLSAGWGAFLWIAAGATLIWGTHKLCAGKEPRQRAVLTTLVIAHLVANAAAGAWSVRLESDDDRMLAAFRAGLRSHSDVTTCILVADKEPPLALQYSLRSLWPAANFQIFRTSNEAPALPNWSKSDFPASPGPLIVEWSEKDTRAESRTPDEEFRIVSHGSPQFYQRRLLRAYRLEWISKE